MALGSRSTADGGDRPARTARPHSASALRPLLAHQRLIVCVGSGGVGKTTAAAAIGLVAARLGRRAAVLTIDPARRLRDTLGLAHLDGEAHRIRLPRAEASGTLHVMLLDAKRTFDDLIRRYAPTDATAERLLGNRIYQSLSTALAGSQEYMAMERLHAIVGEERYDVLVVDTPPTHHALDFLEAPNRLTALLASRAAAILQNPTAILGGEGSRLAQTMLAVILRALERFTGLELLHDLAELAGGLDELSEGFRSRAAAVAEMLRAPTTSYLLVTTAEAARVAETLTFRRELLRAGLPLSGFIVNRVLPEGLVDETAPDEPPALLDDVGLARKLGAVHRRYAMLRAQEQREIARLLRAAPDAVCAEVPLQIVEPTSLRGLAAIGDSLA
jgi:anion-transporting  ArsA/GET3 family ATPase